MIISVVVAETSTGRRGVHLKLKYYGWPPSDDGGTPMIRISGGRLFAFLK